MNNTNTNNQTINFLPCYTLFKKEVLRFWKVKTQTVAAPVLTTLLYLLIFSTALNGRISIYPNINYLQFLIPGLIMMAIIQNAFTNAPSSLVQSKMMGNLVFLLMSPLKPLELFLAYTFAGMVRGLTVGITMIMALMVFAHEHMLWNQYLWIIIFALLGSLMMSILGLIAGIWAEKFDHLAGFQNFVITPASFLSGVFYSTKNLPEFWQTVSLYNPFFYLIDGFRFGMLGYSDASPMMSLAVISASCIILSIIANHWLMKGYKMRDK